MFYFFVEIEKASPDQFLIFVNNAKLDLSCQQAQLPFDN